MNLTAVEVRNAFKLFGKRIKHLQPVLEEFCMKVPTNSVYALCGASGCGKSTIIKSILGEIQLDSGEISIYGHNIRDKEWNNFKVGFMPQEIGLYGYLTVQETFKFFTMIYEINEKIALDKIKELSKIFEAFPNCLIKDLSIGQQKQVSLIVSMLHEPQLLILDEPTVSVDPIIRHKIWKYLTFLAHTKNTTIIISTSYMSEAQNADIVSFMRHGKLLTESPPSLILKEFQVQYLDEIFHKLSMRQKLNENERENILKIYPKDKKIERKSGAKFKNLKAFLWKNLLMMRKKFCLLFFILFLAPFQIFVFISTFGEFSNETSKKMSEKFFDISKNCNFENLSCLLTFEDPIYGKMEFDYGKFSMPGFLLLTIFTTTIISVLTFHTKENENSCFDRCKIMKVTLADQILSNFIVQLIILIVNVTISLLMVFWGLKMTSEIFYLAIECFLTGFLGIFIGFFLSFLTRNKFPGIYSIIFFLTTQNMLSPVLWPFEAFHPSIKFISKLFSLAKPTESLRSILYRGSKSENENFQDGFLFLGFWILLSFFILFLVMRKN